MSGRSAKRKGGIGVRMALAFWRAIGYWIVRRIPEEKWQPQGQDIELIRNLEVVKVEVKYHNNLPVKKLVAWLKDGDILQLYETNSKALPKGECWLFMTGSRFFSMLEAAREGKKDANTGDGEIR